MDNKEENKNAVLIMYQIRCLQLGITRDEAAKKFSCSWQFLLAVLTYKRPMPLWMVPAMSKFLVVDEGIIAIAFGYYPEEWVNLCRYTPEIVNKAMRTLIKNLKASPSFTTHPSRSKTLPK